MTPFEAGSRPQAFHSKVIAFCEDPRNAHLKLWSYSEGKRVGVERRTMSLSQFPLELRTQVYAPYYEVGGGCGFNRIESYLDVLPTTIVAEVDTDPETQAKKTRLAIVRDNIVPSMHSYKRIEFSSDGQRLGIDIKVSASTISCYNVKTYGDEYHADLSEASYDDLDIRAMDQAFRMLKRYSDRERPRQTLAWLRNLAARVNPAARGIAV